MSLLITVVLGGLVGPSPLAVAQSNVATVARYVALGDSYSSGNAIATVLPGSGACARSSSAYPEVVASRLGLTPLRFVACSGATIAQVATQVAAAGASIRTATLVTLSAGGNDLPFSGLSEACIGLVQAPSSSSLTYIPGISGPSRCRAEVSHAAALLGASTVGNSLTAPPDVTSTVIRRPSIIERRLEALYVSILNRESTPRNVLAGTQLIIVQYPSLLVSNGSGSCLLASTPLRLPFASPVNGLFPGFSGQDARLLTQVNALLRRETAAVVTTLQRRGYARISLSSTPPSFVPLNCRTGTSPDLNGVVISPSTSGLTSNAFHPTVSGQSLLAAGVISTFRSHQ